MYCLNDWLPSQTLFLSSMCHKKSIFLYTHKSYENYLYARSTQHIWLIIIKLPVATIVRFISCVYGITYGTRIDYAYGEFATNDYYFNFVYIFNYFSYLHKTKQAQEQSNNTNNGKNIPTKKILFLSITLSLCSVYLLVSFLFCLFHKRFGRFRFIN